MHHRRRGRIRWSVVVGVTLLCALRTACIGALAAAPVPTLIDTDFGLPPIDDAFALALALDSPEIRVLGVTTVAGNQKLAVENAELAAFLPAIGAATVPISSGAARPLETSSAYRAFLDDPQRSSYFAPDQRGARATPPAGARVGPESAVAFITRAVLADPGRVTILCIGPLTNIALAIERNPRVARAIGKLVIGGGYLRAEPSGGRPVDLPGSESRYAEFNFWIDPVAASIVLRSHVPIELVPFNVNEQVPFTPAAYRTLLSGHSKFSALLRTFAPRMPTYDGQPLPMFDEVAVAAFVNPALTTQHQMSVVVVTRHGPSYAESVAGNPRAHQRTVTVLWHPRVAAMRDFIVDRLAR